MNVSVHVVQFPGWVTLLLQFKRLPREIAFLDCASLTYRRMCEGADSQTQIWIRRGEMDWKTISINAPVPFSPERK